jgi:hypothetical protein
MASAPLILTLVLDDVSQAFFNRARQQWFPERLNFIGAHVTMFHHLPGEQLGAIQQLLASVCAAQAPCPVTVNAVRSLGRGVAYGLRAPEVELLRMRLASHWRDVLTAQDRQAWRPHVTVQNKVSPAEARGLLMHVSESFTPFAATATGLALWWYRGGPWESACVMPFSGDTRV